MLDFQEDFNDEDERQEERESDQVNIVDMLKILSS